MARLDIALPGVPYTLYDRELKPSAMRLVLPDGRCMGIEMIAEDEVAFVLHEADSCNEPEIIMSTMVQE